jgi:hypothetical protein
VQALHQAALQAEFGGLSVAKIINTASPIKRHRATRFEMEQRRAALFAICDEQRPMTVRQIYYQAAVRGIIEKTEHGYNKVQSTLSDMRRNGELPYAWITDHTRYRQKPETYDSIEHALQVTAEAYRRNLWARADSYVEIWIEKDALSGVVYPVTSEYDVPLMSARGYASLSFLHSAAMEMAEQERACFVYHFGDFDPSGVNAAEKIEETLRELAPGAEIHFHRVAVTPTQISTMRLPSRPTKSEDSRSKTWTGGDSVELDAIEPAILRGLVRYCIERHLPQNEVALLKAAQASEREALKAFARERGANG